MVLQACERRRCSGLLSWSFAAAPASRTAEQHGWVSQTGFTFNAAGQIQRYRIIDITSTGHTEQELGSASEWCFCNHGDSSRRTRVRLSLDTEIKGGETPPKVTEASRDPKRQRAEWKMDGGFAVGTPGPRLKTQQSNAGRGLDTRAPRSPSLALRRVKQSCVFFHAGAHSPAGAEAAPGEESAWV